MRYLKYFLLNDFDYEILTRGLFFGVSSGLIIGFILKNVPVFFSTFGLFGLIIAYVSLICSKIKER